MGCVFAFWMGSVETQKYFNVDEVQLTSLLTTWAGAVASKKSLLKILSCFSSKSFIISALKFKRMVYFELCIR